MNRRKFLAGVGTAALGVGTAMTGFEWPTYGPTTRHSRQCGYRPHRFRRDDLDGGESPARCVDRGWSRKTIAMGRTSPTYRDARWAIEHRWRDFRRPLRRRDQPRFDQLFAYTRTHADASGLLNHQNPLLPALLSVGLEQVSRLAEFQ